MMLLLLIMAAEDSGGDLGSNVERYTIFGALAFLGGLAVKLMISVPGLYKGAIEARGEDAAAFRAEAAAARAEAAQANQKAWLVQEQNNKIQEQNTLIQEQNAQLREDLGLALAELTDLRRKVATWGPGPWDGQERRRGHPKEG